MRRIRASTLPSTHLLLSHPGLWARNLRCSRLCAWKAHCPHPSLSLYRGKTAGGLAARQAPPRLWHSAPEPPPPLPTHVDVKCCALAPGRRTPGSSRVLREAAPLGHLGGLHPAAGPNTGERRAARCGGAARCAGQDPRSRQTQCKASGVRRAGPGGPPGRKERGCVAAPCVGAPPRGLRAAASPGGLRGRSATCWAPVRSPQPPGRPFSGGGRGAGSSAAFGTPSKASSWINPGTLSSFDGFLHILCAWFRAGRWGYPDA